MVSWRESLEDRLRRRILATFHRGGRRPGDRLPSIRRLAAELDVDHRAVARAYHRLKEEGLVEIRPRSGVYLAPQETLGPDSEILSETAVWLGDVLYEAWQRGMSSASFLETLSRTLDPASLTVLCVETVRDPLESVSEEVEKILGVECERTLVGEDAAASDSVRLREAIHAHPDFAVTTVYHAGVRGVMEEEGIPLMLSRLNPEWVGTLRRWAEETGLVIVGADPGVRLRFRDVLGSDVDPGCVTVEEIRGRTVPRDGTIYATVLARRSLPRKWASRVRVPEAPLFDPATVRELTGMLVQASLRR